MARLWMDPCETKPNTAGWQGLGLGGYDLVGGAAAIVLDTAVFHGSNGKGSFRFDSGAGGLQPEWGIDIFNPSTGTSYFRRDYFRFTTLPTAATRIVKVGDSGFTQFGCVTLTTAGKLQLRSGAGAGAQVGSDSTETIAAADGKWHRIELRHKIGAGAVDELELLLNGVQVAVGTGLTLTDSAACSYHLGWMDAPGVNKTLYVDDMAVNDDQGVNQNSWVGDSYIQLLLPASDSSRVGWTAGAGATTSLFDAVNNLTPLGVSVATATNLTQIKDLANNATDAYVANMQDYTTAGIPSGATILCVQPYLEGGQDSVTQTDIKVAVSANPAGTTLTRTMGATVAGTWPTGWRGFFGSPVYSPSVASAAQPTVTITKNTSSATITQTVDAIVLLTEYTPVAAVLAAALPARLPFSTGTAGTYYVNTVTGNDTRTTAQAQSPSTPWKTINKALSTVPLTGGPIIVVSDGTYNSNGSSSYVIDTSRQFSTTDPCTVKAQNPGGVIIGSANGPAGAFTFGAWIHNATGVRLQGLTFSVRGYNSSVGNGSVGVLVESGSWVEMYGCTFNNGGGTGYQNRGDTTNPGSHFDLYACQFGPNLGLDAHSGPSTTPNDYYITKGSHQAYVGQDQGAGNSTESGVTNSVIGNCTFRGTIAGRLLELGPQARNYFVVNNTFYGNRASYVIAGTAIELFTNGGSGTYQNQNVIMKNNLMVFCTGAAIYGSNAAAQSGHLAEKNMAWSMDCNPSEGDGYTNDVFFPNKEPGPSGTVLYTSTTNTQQDPLLNDPANGDLRVQAGSPALTIAIPAFTPADDILGTARAAAPTLGAYEQPIGAAAGGSTAIFQTHVVPGVAVLAGATW